MNTSLKLLLTSAAVVLASFATGCAGVKTSFQPAEGPSHSGVAPSTLLADREVEVLLDSAPTRPFKVVGEIAGNSGSATHSIEAMKERAAAAGLDGIYWIDCTSPCSGHCTAKGYVYTDKPSLENVAKSTETVASR